MERGAQLTGSTAKTASGVLQTATHRLTCPCARNSAMSALQVGQGLTTLRTRIVRPAFPARSSGSPQALPQQRITLCYRRMKVRPQWVLAG